MTISLNKRDEDFVNMTYRFKKFDNDTFNNLEKSVNGHDFYLALKKFQQYFTPSFNSNTRRVRNSILDIFIIMATRDAEGLLNGHR